jgi:hypothetical protein
MRKYWIPLLFQYAALALAMLGLIFCLRASDWGMAVIFVFLVAYVWRVPLVRPHLRAKSAAPAQPATAPPPQRRNEPADYRVLEWKGMIFRSKSEIKIAKTLDHRGIFFIPPARVRLNAGKAGRQTRELDFVICHEGKWGVLEVDGPFHVAQADAERDAMLRTHGITSIQRFPSLRCFQTPQAVIDEFLFHLEEGA